jgi:hypothetical protein
MGLKPITTINTASYNMPWGLQIITKFEVNYDKQERSKLVTRSKIILTPWQHKNGMQFYFNI